MRGAEPQAMELPLLIALTPEPNSLVVAAAQDQARPHMSADQMGFRYRIPLPVTATFHRKPNAVSPATDSPALTDATRLVDKEFPLEIAQLGPTLALPRKAGLFGGTVGANFVGSTGRLKLFKTDAAAGPASTVVTQVQTELGKDRRLEALEKEEHELDIRAKIKAHNEALSTAPGATGN